jgi:hypothetical protein
MVSKSSSSTVPSAVIPATVADGHLIFAKMNGESERQISRIHATLPGFSGSLTEEEEEKRQER